MNSVKLPRLMMLVGLLVPFKYSKLVSNAPLRLRTGLLLFGPALPALIFVASDYRGHRSVTLVLAANGRRLAQVGPDSDLRSRPPSALFPGSGKSTFANALVASDSQAFSGISQDECGGSRQQCEAEFGDTLRKTSRSRALLCDP